MTGLKSIKSKMHNSNLIKIKREDGIIKLTPTNNGGHSGANKGFSFLDDLSIILNQETDAEKIGLEIYNSIQKCS